MDMDLWFTIVGELTMLSKLLYYRVQTTYNNGQSLVISTIVAWITIYSL